MNHVVAHFGIVCAVTLSISTWVQAAGKPKSVTPDAAEEVLQRESQTTEITLDRRDVLKPGTRAEGDSNAVWWQAGYTLSGKQWVKYEDSLASDARLALIDEYRTQRSKLTGQPHGEWQLANWCRKNGLPDQERVHLLRVLVERDTVANVETVYERLGCQKVDDGWVSPQERRDNARLQAEVDQSHQRWDSKFALLVKQLEGAPKQKAQAEKQLSEVTDSSAVPAIISSFCTRTQPLAETGIKVLGQIPEYQASRALAGQAVFSPWKSVRMRSVELLKQRKFEEFVPDLLLLLSSPVRVGIVPNAQNPNNGELTNWDYVWIEETQDTIWVGIGRLVPIGPSSSNTIVYSRRLGRVLSQNGSFVYEAMAAMAKEQDLLKFEAERVSDFRSGLNERVAKILSDCTNEPMNSDPKHWWNWWTTFSAVSPGEKKKVVVPAEKRFVQAPIITRITYVSCFAAGTPVWTERGPIAIEQILPGDRVLSKDINSGELTYKPVVQVTKRQPTAVLKFQVGEDEIVASAGHHFWVSGEGWTKTRQLATNQPLHTVTGMARISSIIEEKQEAEVYNLVVSDFHTYFVGKTMVLSHDVTTPQLTNVKVPGLTAK